MSHSTIASHTIFKGKLITVNVDQARQPDGTTGEFEMVRHPGASAVLPFLSDPGGDDPQILLLRQWRYAADAYLLEIPAGKLEHDEAPRACAVRELKEETGCTAERVDHLTTVYTTPGFTDEVIHIFIATGITRGESAREDDEFVEVETLRLSQALRMIQTNEIRDGKTALAILYAAGFQGNGGQ